jgi:hypothetical protein
MAYRRSIILAAALLFGVVSFTFGMGGWGPATKSSSSYGDTTGVSGAAMVSTWSGFLVDRTSGLAMKSGDVDVTTMPQDLTKTAEMANSGGGFGISILQEDNTYRFFPFDAQGNKLASQVLSMSKRDKGLSIVVRGNVVDGIVKVSSITESNI